MSYAIATTTYASHQAGIQEVRRRVFIEEQGIDPAEEWDAQDATAMFAVAIDQHNQVIGTARLLESGRIGRMAVLAAYRRQGVGSALLRHLLSLARQRGHTQITISAQQAAMAFYAKQGFAPIGPPHVEVGIPHQTMQRTL